MNGSKTLEEPLQGAAAFHAAELARVDEAIATRGENIARDTRERDELLIYRAQLLGFGTPGVATAAAPPAIAAAAAAGSTAESGETLPLIEQAAAALKEQPEKKWNGADVAAATGMTKAQAKNALQLLHSHGRVYARGDGYYQHRPTDPAAVAALLEAGSLQIHVLSSTDVDGLAVLFLTGEDGKQKLAKDIAAGIAAGIDAGIENPLQATRAALVRALPYDLVQVGETIGFLRKHSVRGSEAWWSFIVVSTGAPADGAAGRVPFRDSSPGPAE
jgi:hypothetical protein